MNPRHIILAAVGIAAAILGVLFTVALKRHNAEHSRIEHIPDITLVTYDGEEFSLSEIDDGKKTAILFFSTDCEFCRKEIDGIITDKDKLTDIGWVFVVLPPAEDLGRFLLEHRLFSIPGAKVCIAESPELTDALDVTTAPSIFIYGSDGVIEYYKRSAVSIKTIIEWLEEQ